MATQDPVFHRFFDQEYQRRYAAERRKMEAHGIDALVAVDDSGGRTANQANIYHASICRAP